MTMHKLITASIALGVISLGLPALSANAEPLPGVLRNGPPRITAPQPQHNYCKIVVNGHEDWRPCPGAIPGRVSSR